MPHAVWSCQKNHFSTATAALGGPLHTQDAGNDAQNLFHAPLGLVHKQASRLIQFLATEVCI